MFLHTIRFQTERNGKKRRTQSEIKRSYIEKINSDKSGKHSNINLDVPMLEPDHDLLGFLLDHGKHFKDWQIDLIEIVKDESQYFIPQIKTKILNEGWASFWHYKIMHDLDLPQSMHIPFIKSHNQVIRPHLGQINPYHVGFYIFEKLEREEGLEQCFFTREIHNDESAIRCLLTMDDYRELNLFSYSEKKRSITIDEISDEEGWQRVRSDLIRSVGGNSIPMIYVSDISKSGNLILQHDHDGRDIDLDHAENVIGGLMKIWPNQVKFFTIIEDEPWEI